MTEKRREKIAIVVENDLEDWQKLNVTAFLASSVAIEFPMTHGKSLVTASKSEFLPLINQPILIYKANGTSQMRRALQRARDRNLNVGVYTRPLFATKCEEENLLEVSKTTDDQLELVGISMYGDGKKVSKALDGLKFHP